MSQEDEVEKLQKMADEEEDSDLESTADSIDSQQTGIPEDDDESDLSPETIESIRKAEEYASSIKDDDSDDSDIENEPLELGDDLPETELGLEDIEKSTDSIDKRFDDIKIYIKNNNEEQLDKIDELKKTVEKDKLKSQGIVIEDSKDREAEGNKSILLVDDDAPNDDEEDNESSNIRKSVTIG